MQSLSGQGFLAATSQRPAKKPSSQLDSWPPPVKPLSQEAVSKPRESASQQAQPADRSGARIEVCGEAPAFQCQLAGQSSTLEERPLGPPAGLHIELVAGGFKRYALAS